jgi:adenosylcobinamide kinase/adenosylcobinamide-phosphate guanylyltransferase
MKTLILGGARSGKTALALSEAAKSGLECVYIATGAAGDAEMAARIANHRAERGPLWQTIEEPVDLAGVLVAQSRPDRALLVDCLTLWLSNIILAEMEVSLMGEALAQALAVLPGSIFMVSNEVGLGIVPDNALARRFRDEQGRLNQRIASLCDRVVFVAAGLPLVLKG